MQNYVKYSKIKTLVDACIGPTIQLYGGDIMKRGTEFRNDYNSIASGIAIGAILGMLFYPNVAFLAFLAYFSMDFIRKIVDYCCEREKLDLFMAILDITIIFIYLWELSGLLIRLGWL